MYMPTLKKVISAVTKSTELPHKITWKKWEKATLLATLKQENIPQKLRIFFELIKDLSNEIAQWEWRSGKEKKGDSKKIIWIFERKRIKNAIKEVKEILTEYWFIFEKIWEVKAFQQALNWINLAEKETKNIKLSELIWWYEERQAISNYLRWILFCFDKIEESLAWKSKEIKYWNIKNILLTLEQDYEKHETQIDNEIGKIDQEIETMADAHTELTNTLDEFEENKIHKHSFKEALELFIKRKKSKYYKKTKWKEKVDHLEIGEYAFEKPDKLDGKKMRKMPQWKDNVLVFRLPTTYACFARKKDLEKTQELDVDNRQPFHKSIYISYMDF